MTDIKAQVKCLNEVAEALSQASGACSQLIHHFQDPRFIILRDVVDLARERIMVSAMAATRRTVITKGA